MKNVNMASIYRCVTQSSIVIISIFFAYMPLHAMDMFPLLEQDSLQEQPTSYQQELHQFLLDPQFPSEPLDQNLPMNQQFSWQHYQQTSVKQNNLPPQVIDPQSLSNSRKRQPPLDNVSLHQSDLLLSSQVVKARRIHTGERPFICPQCGKTFNRKNDLKNHQIIHTGEKPFICPQCSKSFNRRGNLKDHQKIHTDKKSFICSECGKAFRVSKSLIGHKRIHTGEKPFVCSECGQAFRLRESLIGHQRIHTGEKPFVCSECGKAFSLSKSLIGHQRIHTGQKPFVCSECGEAFSRRGTLINHQRIHTGEKPFACVQCRKAYRYKGDLNRHLKTREHFHQKNNENNLE